MIMGHKINQTHFNKYQYNNKSYTQHHNIDLYKTLIMDYYRIKNLIEIKFKYYKNNLKLIKFAT